MSELSNRANNFQQTNMQWKARGRKIESPCLFLVDFYFLKWPGLQSLLHAWLDTCSKFLCTELSCLPRLKLKVCKEPVLDWKIPRDTASIWSCWVKLQHLICNWCLVSGLPLWLQHEKSAEHLLQKKSSLSEKIRTSEPGQGWFRLFQSVLIPFQIKIYNVLKGLS